MDYERPYQGIKVVDLSQGIAGPYCSMLLAQYGADVIKIEPMEGDWTRLLGNQYGGETAFSLVGNLGKKSIALDLKSDEGRQLVLEMVDGAHLFMEGFRPGVIQRLGLDYETVHAINPKIIYLSISGFGQTGPLSSKPAMDPLLQAFTGFSVENKGYDGIPHRTQPIIVDMSTALYSFQAVSAALFAQRELDTGRFIDSSLMQAAANLQVVRMMSSYIENGAVPPGSAPSGVFLCADDRWIQTVVLRDKDYKTFCKVLDLEELASNPDYADVAGRRKHFDYLNGIVANTLRTQPAEHWRGLLTEAGLQNEVLQDYQTFLQHPQTEATDVVSWIQPKGFDKPIPHLNPPGTPRLEAESPLAKAPGIGEHTREILTAMGKSEADIDALITSGAAADQGG